jgi:hypothetical protein
MPVAPIDPGTLSAADDVYFVAEGVRDVAQDACNEVVVVLGEGGNGRAACIITDAIYLAAKAVNQKLHFCDNDYAASTVAANYDRLGHIHSDLAASVANDNSNKTAIISNDNSNKTEIITNDDSNTTNITNNDNANKTTIVNLINTALANIIGNANSNKEETKNLMLRTQIEADLSSTDGSTFVALYETASSVCSPSLDYKGLPVAGLPNQCGLLDLVRSIVSQTISNMGAGTTAASDFAKGDVSRAAGRYKEAYTYYRKAYKTAAK